MNHYDIDEAVRAFEHRHPVLGPAARFLKDYQEGIDSMSDGWSHWHHGTKCSKQLQGLLEREMQYLRYDGRSEADRPTVEQLQREASKALAPIKAFVTRRIRDGKTPPPLPTLQVHEPRLPLDSYSLVPSARI